MAAPAGAGREEGAVKAYTEELVYTASEDGLSLEGAVIAPAEGESRPIAVVWVHGLTGKFYGRTTVNIGRELAGRGYVFVTGNNRGHDFGAVYRDPVRRAAYLRMYGNICYDTRDQYVNFPWSSERRP